MRIPISTYRLQIREGFPLANAAAIADYIHDLGADWLYLSPMLKAEEGSDHGYDVIDHSRVDDVRGGAEGLAEASAAAREPAWACSSTSCPTTWAWRHRRAEPVVVGPADARSRVEVRRGIRRRLGVRRRQGADSRFSATRTSPSSTIVDGELRYYENRFPIAPGTADDGADAATVHVRQHYELMNWRRADAELNYRRFFAVNTLAGIRVEVPWVFDESHAEIVRWIHEGLVDGLRVDHPDGLADPGGYLDALAAATGGAYVLVEKILEGDEQLPTSLGDRGHHRIRRARPTSTACSSTRPAAHALDALDAQHRRCDADDSRVLDGPHPRHEARRSPTESCAPRFCASSATLGASVERVMPTRVPRSPDRRRSRRAAGVLPRVPLLPAARHASISTRPSPSAQHRRPDLTER